MSNSVSGSARSAAVRGVALALAAVAVTVLETLCPDSAKHPLPSGRSSPVFAGGPLPTAAPSLPIQRPRFAEAACLVRVRLALNEGCSDRMEVRHWGRIGTHGRCRPDPHPDPGAAIDALAALCQAKRRRGYQDRT